MSESRISGLYRQSIDERIGELERRDWLSAADAESLRQGRYVLSTTSADRMIENVVGIYGLPLAMAPNFVVNGRGYIVPLVVEEPSIVAATSNAARLAIGAGGFVSHCDESLLAGQIHVTDITDPDTAVQALHIEKQDLIARANDVHPRLLERGGGVRDIEVRRIELTDARPVLVVHFLVDTCDAMGANLVNTLCEAMAPRIIEICGGEAALRILSNLADRSLVTATVRYRLSDLGANGFAAEAVRDGIVTASDIAAVDPYRAATHNKGIMNGVDALAIATGNDWRAIEAGAHAFAASSGQYRPLAAWAADTNGDLLGTMTLPLKVGTVGGTMAANPSAGLALRITGVASARELAELMAAVGLAQNFAAVRVLATRGIQEGHMRLHARSAAVTADIRRRDSSDRPLATAAGKVILLGEHAVVYGRHALALPIADAVSAHAVEQDSTTLTLPEWGVQHTFGDGATAIDAMISMILQELDIENQSFGLEVHSKLPRAMGLGSSAAIAVAITRAIISALKLGLDDARVNEIAFACEKLAHGTPSGVDNTLATYAAPMLFRNSGTMQSTPMKLSEDPPLVVALGGQQASTKRQVDGVRERRNKLPARYGAVFDEIDTLTMEAAQALQDMDYSKLGSLMNLCHGLLNAIEVSTVELESMINIARAAGAVGAKLTGSGGGGSIVALCPDATDDVVTALHNAGFTTLSLASKGTANLG